MRINDESFQESTPHPASPTSRLQEIPRTEKEKLKSMNKKDRIWYIWEYYKFHMLGVLIAAVVLWTIGTSMYRASFDTVFYCMYINSRSETELNTAPVEEGFAQYLNISEKQLISAESSFISFGDDVTEFSYATMAKISALVASKDLDVIIGDDDTFSHYASLEGFSDLEAELPEDVLTLIQDHLLFASGEDGVPHAYGVSLEGTWFDTESNLGQDPPILGMISNSTHKDNVSSFLRYIFAP